MRITNDASTDNSKKIINYYKNIYKKKKIEFFCSHNKKNIGKTLSNANQIRKVNSFNDPNRYIDTEFKKFIEESFAEWKSDNFEKIIKDN